MIGEYYMKIIPNYIWQDAKPENIGEHRVFELLKEIQGNEKMIACHSINLRGDRKQMWYELDFLILTSKCIYGVEVKTGYLSTNEGDWRIHKSNMDVAYVKKKSPYVQAKDALLHWRNKWLFKEFPEIRGKIEFAFVSCLLMNDKKSLQQLNSIELPIEVTLSQEQFTETGILDLLNSSYKYHVMDRGLKEPSGLSKEQLERIVHKLRPSVEKSYPSGLRNFLIESQDKLTEEQYNLLDQLDFFERLIIDGGAGTGKTFMLSHLIRKHIANNAEKILVLTRPILLAKKLAAIFKDESSVVVVKPDELPLLENDYFQSLYVDEGQDLCNEYCLDHLDRVLEGGLQNSTWRWFGDFQNQLGCEVEFSSDVFELLTGLTGNNAVFLLTRNVRNTPSVIHWLEAVCQARMGETKVRGSGPEVIIEDQSLFPILLNEVLQDPTLQESPDEAVVMIYPEAFTEVFDIAPFRSQLNLKNIPSIDSESFKGLESEVVFAWVPENLTDDKLSDYLYKSVSRARAICFVLGVDGKKLLDQVVRISS